MNTARELKRRLGVMTIGCCFLPWAASDTAAQPAFVTVSNPPVNHTGVTSRPAYNPGSPRSASFIDPMSGLEVFRIGGDNGSTLYINGTQDSGLKFPRCLRQDNNPRMQKVWNADATLLYIGRRFAAKGDPANAAGSYLVDVRGTHGAAAPWLIIRASVKSGLGDLDIANHRSVRTGGADECHPNVSPDSEYIVFNSNWHEPGVEKDGDVHPYVVIIPPAWYSPDNDGSAVRLSRHE